MTTAAARLEQAPSNDPKVLMLTPHPSPEALEHAARLGHFGLGVPCCAGALPGGRIRVVALEPVTALDLGVARMKLERWYPWAVEAIELAAAGRWP